MRSYRWIRTVLVLHWILALCYCHNPHEQELHPLEAIKPGMSEEEVKSRLGLPTYELWRDKTTGTLYNRNDKGDVTVISKDPNTGEEDYYRKGWSHEDRFIEHKALIYYRAKYTLYIYLNQSNKVDYAFIGGT